MAHATVTDIAESAYLLLASINVIYQLCKPVLDRGQEDRTSTEKGLYIGSSVLALSISQSF